jgi:hypothetical protein
VVLVRLELALFNSRVEREGESSLLAVPKSTRKSRREQARPKSCSLVKTSCNEFGLRPQMEFITS